MEPGGMSQPHRESAAVPSKIHGFEIRNAASSTQISQARELFLEYAASLNFSLCFQNFEKELADLPGEYAPPSGRLLIGEYQNELAGCVALHKLEDDVCEMKRLYLRSKFRGKGLGQALTEFVISEARAIGYLRMRLDTVGPVMQVAMALYRELGFREIDPYRANPVAGALYMELEL